MLFTFKDKGGFRKKVGLLKKLYKYLPVLTLVLLGCGDDETVWRPSDAEYFPLRKGFYQVYEVNETEYLNIDNSTTSFYQLKTEVVDSFVNQQGGYTYTIHRSKRTSTNDAWVFQQVWSVRMNTSDVVVSQENVPYVKIAFPATSKHRWDGNALNNLPTDEYELTETGKSYQLPDGTTGAYIRVVQEDEEDPIIFVNKRQEIYVRNIGLVKREINDVEYCTTQGQCEIGAQVIKSGTVYVQTLIEYGQN